MVEPAAAEVRLLHERLLCCSTFLTGSPVTIEAKELVIRRAMDQAGVDRRTITLVEGHGTGTPVSDAIELTALKNMLGEGSEGERVRRERVAVGSTKSQIGHPKAVAGSACLLKVRAEAETGAWLEETPMADRPMAGRARIHHSTELLSSPPPIMHRRTALLSPPTAQRGASLRRPLHTLPTALPTAPSTAPSTVPSTQTERRARCGRSFSPQAQDPS